LRAVPNGKGVNLTICEIFLVQSSAIHRIEVKIMGRRGSDDGSTGAGLIGGLIGAGLGGLAGYGKGHADGYQEGINDGYQRDRTEGYQEGRQAGIREGHEKGFSEGYNKAMKEIKDAQAKKEKGT
jgi:hypothetical protein